MMSENSQPGCVDAAIRAMKTTQILARRAFFYEQNAGNPAESQPSVWWEALYSRNERFDGRFFIGAATTGIYCRPICPFRLPSQIISSGSRCGGCQGRRIPALPAMPPGNISRNA